MFMCIRITKELKDVYEKVMKINLGYKVQYPTFVSILVALGYIDRQPNSMTGMLLSIEQLVKLAWQTVHTKCKPSEIYAYQSLDESCGPYEEIKELNFVECLTFENFAMLLNLINNVYIKNSSKPSKSVNEVIDEEEEGCEDSNRPYGYVDSQDRFMASSQAEVDKMFRKFYPLLINKRKKSTKRPVN